MSIVSAKLDIENVTIRAGKIPLVKQASLKIAPGEVVGLIGPNGAGKSTLLRSIYRVSRPFSGRVRVNDEDVWQRPANWVAQRVAAVLQDMPGDFPLTVRDVVAMGRSAHKALLEPETHHDLSLIDAALTLQQLNSLQHRPFRTLSGGERQRTLLARALVQQPQIMVLDEPTNHLDIRHQISLLRFVREVGVTVIAALHDLNLAATYCDRLCLMQHGRIIADGAPETVLTTKRLAEVYGIDALVQRHPKTGRIWIIPD